jgi:hypothetical protein
MIFLPENDERNEIGNDFREGLQHATQRDAVFPNRIFFSVPDP